MKISTYNEYSIYCISLVRCNCYLLKSKDRSILIDTGVKRERKKIVSFLKKHHVHQLDCIILTHSHSDHAQNAAYFQNYYRCPIYAHRLAIYPLLGGYCSVPKGAKLYSKLVERLARVSKSWNQFPPCFDVRDIQTLPWRDYFRIQNPVFNTPGHSADSITLVFDDIAIVGDSMTNVIGNNVLPPFVDNKKQLMYSWYSLLLLDIQTFYPAHGTEISLEKARYSYFHYYKAIY